VCGASGGESPYARINRRCGVANAHKNHLAAAFKVATQEHPVTLAAVKCSGAALTDQVLRAMIQTGMCWGV
jgi:hypothetical protein